MLADKGVLAGGAHHVIHSVALQGAPAVARPVFALKMLMSFLVIFLRAAVAAAGATAAAAAAAAAG